MTLAVTPVRLRIQTVEQGSVLIDLWLIAESQGDQLRLALGLKSCDETGSIPAPPTHLLHFSIVAIDQLRHVQHRTDFFPLRPTRSSGPCASIQRQIRIRIHYLTIVCQRFSICHDWAAPFEIASMTFAVSRLARFAKCKCFGKTLHDTGDTDLVHHLCELSGTDRPDQRHGFGVAIHNRHVRARTSDSSPPTMIVN